MARKLYKNGCDVKLDEDYQKKLMKKVNKLYFLPRGIPCKDIEYYQGDECVLCSKKVSKVDEYVSPPLMMRLYNPARKKWISYDVHPECLREHIHFMKCVYKIFNKKNPIKGQLIKLNALKEMLWKKENKRMI